ncbi:MAG: chemotaxis protein CheW [Wenzhouxiangella sp.]|nr:chemotaxis protein CheW [Wenzhouxiangella sp.]
MTTTAIQKQLEQRAGEDTSAQYLTFYLQDEMFGMNIKPIREITDYGHITKVPMMPDYVRGVVNLRGNVVPVIDLPVRFGWESSPLNKRTCIVMLELQTSEDSTVTVGIVIDSVSEVLEIDADHINPPPKMGAKIARDFISGMARIDENFIVLLNPQTALLPEELDALSEQTLALESA